MVMPTDELGYAPPRPVSELLPLIDQAWRHFYRVMERVPPERMNEPGVCDEWSVKDLIGHVAFWDGQVIDDIDGYVARRPPLKNPWNAWNAEEAAKRADLSLDELSVELSETHERMLARLSNVTEIDPEMIADDTWEHYAEHAAEIERWLKSIGT
jgi:uncharacterized protein (TIGR03083 family)